MGINKSPLITKVLHEGKEDSFYVTKVVETACLYFLNDQKQIAKNVKTFGINPTSATEEEGGVTFTKRESNVIVTIAVKMGYKEVFVQFLIKSGLTPEHLVELMKLPKNIRYFPFLDIIQQGIRLTKELTAEDLTFNKTSTLKVEVKAKESGTTIMKKGGKA